MSHMSKTAALIIAPGQIVWIKLELFLCTLLKQVVTYHEVQPIIQDHYLPLPVGEMAREAVYITMPLCLMCLHSMSIWSILHALVIMTVPFTDNSLCVHLTKSYTYGLLLKNVNREQMIIKWFQTLALLQWEREKKNLIFILLFWKFYFWGVCFKKKDTVYWCQHTINHLHTLWPKSASTHPPRHTIKKSVYTHPSMHTMGLPKSAYTHPPRHTITKASTQSPIQTYH